MASRGDVILFFVATCVKLKGNKQTQALRAVCAHFHLYMKSASWGAQVVSFKPQ